MDFLRAAAVQEFRGLSQLGAADNGVVDQQETPAFNEFVDRDQLHLRDQVTLGLDGRHEGPGPGGSVFDEGARERNAGLIGVADGVGDAGIRHACHTVDLMFCHAVPPRQQLSAPDTHGFHGDPFVAGGRIAIVDPEESADPHFAARGRERRDAVRRHDGDLAGTQPAEILVPEVQVGEGLEGGAETVLLFTDHDGSPAQFVAGQVDALGGHQHDGHGAVDDILRVADAVDQVVSFVDEGRHQLRSVDHSAAHFHELGAALLQDLVGKRVDVVDASHCGDGVGAVVGTYDQGLGLIVGDTSDAHPAAHAFYVAVKFRTEGAVLNVVDGPVEAVLAVHRHARSSGAEVRVVVRSEKQIKHTVAFQCRCKYSAHLNSNL